MPKGLPQLAKLSRPRLHNAVARERLFKLLEQAGQRRVICVVGPPGAGKTSLVASWLDACKLPGLWYQVDSSDADLATFFHYLGQAALPFSRRVHRPLPALTPEYLGDVLSFTRRFFRELFSRLPLPSAVVLDNYQEVPTESAFHEIVAAAIEELPEGIIFFVVSRADLPPPYARLIANQDVTFIEWDDLKLTLPETRAIAQSRSNLRDSGIDRLHEKSGGWAAGLTLLAERLQRGGRIEDIDAPDSLEDIFNYFAGQLFDRAPEDTQLLLIKLSFLPSVTDRQAAQLGGHADAGRLLEDLWRRHLFVDRRKGTTPAYVFHGLFQTFLQHRAQDSLDPVQRADLARRAAQLLEASCQIEEAMRLYLRAGDTVAAAELLLRNAARLIGQGRWKVAVEWIGSLPEEMVRESCWLLHWLGSAKIAIDASLARETLERSFDLAFRDGDELCQIQAAAGIIQTHILQYTHFRPLDKWIDVLVAKLSQRIEFTSVEAELRPRSALIIALAYRRPDHPNLQAYTERVFELLGIDAEPNIRLAAAAHLFAYGTTTGPLSLARRTLPVLRALLRHPEITPLNAAWAWFIVSYLHTISREFAHCRQALSRIEAIGRDQALPGVFKFSAIMGTWACLFEQDLVGARRGLQDIEATMDVAHLYDRATYHVTKGFLLLLNGELDATVRHYATALPLFDEAGSVMHRVMYRIILAFALAEKGEWAEARQRIAEVREVAGPYMPSWQAGGLYAAEANLALREGDDALAEKALRSLFQSSQEDEVRGFVNWFGKWMPNLCAEALARSIEVEHVHHLIQVYGWHPPSPDVQVWPWPIKIYALGLLEIRVDNVLLASRRKAPRRVLDLLKAIIVAGGQQVACETLAEQLWPDAEGDVAQDNLKTSLRRLRSLLKCAEIVRVRDGKVSLDAMFCWIDVWAFDGLALKAAVNGPADLSSEQCSLVEQALALYRGHLLAQESHAWILPMRHRLLARYLQLVLSLGEHSEINGNYEYAAKIYGQALVMEPLAEPICRRLMLCLKETGRTAEAVDIYRRCERSLWLGRTGSKPSPETRAVYEALLRG